MKRSGLTLRVQSLLGDSGAAPRASDGGYSCTFLSLQSFHFNYFQGLQEGRCCLVKGAQSALQKYSHPLDIVTFCHFKATNIMGFIENAQLKPEVYIYQKETHIHMFSSPSKVKSDQISCLWKSNDANYHPIYTITTSCSEAVFVNKGREGDHL